MYTQQINDFIRHNDLPLYMNTETRSGENSFYLAIFQLIMIHKSDFHSLDLKLSDLTPLRLKSSLIQYRRSVGTEDVACENCRNLCKTGADHLNYLSNSKVQADDIIFQTVPLFLKLSLCLIFQEFKPQYFTVNTSTNLVFYLFNIPGIHFQALLPNVSDSILRTILFNFNPAKSVRCNANKHISFLCPSCNTAIKPDDEVKICPDCRKEFHKEVCLTDHGCKNVKTNLRYDGEIRIVQDEQINKGQKDLQNVPERRKVKDNVLDKIWKTQKSVVTFKNFFINNIVNQHFNINSMLFIKQVDYFSKPVIK